MKNSLETRLGVFVVLVIFAAFFIMETLGSIESFHGGYRVSALFDTVQDLKVGSSVKMAGVEIGRVEKIALAGNKVTVTMKLHSDAVVKTDSKAVIKFAGLMGQNFVAIDFGTPAAPRAVGGTVLVTEEQPDLNAIMTKLDGATTGIQNLTKSFTPDTINNLMGPLIDFVKQNSGHIGGAISNIEYISGQIASGQGTVGKLIYSDALYDSALVTVTNLQDAVGEVRGVVGGITNGQGTIGKLVTDETLYNETTASMTNLNQILQKVNQGQGTVGKLVNDQEFYKNAKLSLQKLDKMADGLEDQGPLSVIGIMANNFF
ncbi:MAG: MlaD family protein [Verrucomicrobiota bacterium]|jgi:phospholipid/cholesterol/gamma-HCH transport system substrate-binding protein